MFGSLITHSHFSFLRGACSPEKLVERASVAGHTALCLTDWNGVYGAVRLQRACRSNAIKPVIGCTIEVAGTIVRLVAKNIEGYANINTLLTCLHRLEVPMLSSWEPLHALQYCYVLLHDVTSLPISFPTENVVVCLDHQCRPGDGRAARLAVQAALNRELRICIAPDVRYAVADDYLTYDVLTCTRLGITVFDPHIERPVNDQQYIRTKEELLTILPYPEAYRTTEMILHECTFDLLPGYITPPSAKLPEHSSADAVIHELCIKALPTKYPDVVNQSTNAQHSEDATVNSRTAKANSSTIQSCLPGLRTRARLQLEHELAVISELGLSDFFLVVKEIVDEATRRRIRHSGRGSAANSIVAYLLGITGVCPISHNLLFERFLHRGRKGTPDIDVDFDSDRRQEIIDWMEERFGTMHTAMTATLITYRARMAVRDAAKALGWPMEIVNKLSKAIPGFTNKNIESYRNDLVAIVGDAPLLTTLLKVVTLLIDTPRHLGLHSGGMILSAKPLIQFTPVQRSANGTSVVQFDKDDVEAMGLVKFDVLGLRMLACISETVELIHSTCGTLHCDVDNILSTMQYNDPNVLSLIRSGNTLGLFQIESQGQMHLLAQHQPECFNDLITEVALFRPGPLQGGMVHPYVRRRRGLEPVTYAHPSLEPILKDTLGIVLFQEQVLEIAHRFAGMPLDEADDFRALVSKNRDVQAMAEMQDKFVKGAMACGVEHQCAKQVYETVSHFVGYGFCRSHAAAFARIVYQSAWLKCYYPAAYMAAFMQHRPGFYNLMTLEEEARRLGVPILLPDINVSGVRYQLETLPNNKLAIRKPLSSIEHVTLDTARHIVWERTCGVYTSTEDLWSRTQIDNDMMDSIALSGALDSIDGNSRRALWKIGVLYQRGKVQLRRRNNNRYSSSEYARLGQRAAISVCPTIADIPEFPQIRAQERLAYDYITHGAARVHPMTLYRRVLNEMEVLPIDRLKHFSNHTNSPTVAGIVILRQSPPTAHGVLFVTIEDETGFVQCVVEPNEREYFKDSLRHSALIVRGVVHAKANWRGVVVREVRILRNVIGGFHGHPSMYGGTDSIELSTPSSDAAT